MVRFTVHLIIGGHKFIKCLQQTMLTSDVFMENPFVNSEVIDLSNCEIVRFSNKNNTM